jgi:hypothetical protein
MFCSFSAQKNCLSAQKSWKSGETHRVLSCKPLPTLKPS